MDRGFLYARIFKRLHISVFRYRWSNSDRTKGLYYTWDSLWKIWLVESIQSTIHNSLWTWHDKCNICCRYCIYHVKFNVCLVTKPLGVFSSETKRCATLVDCRLADLQTCRLADLQTCRLADLQTCRLADLESQHTISILSAKEVICPF